MKNYMTLFTFSIFICYNKSIRLPTVSSQYRSVSYWFLHENFVHLMIKQTQRINPLYIIPFRSTWVHTRFLVGFMLRNLQFYMYVLYTIVCPFVLFRLAIMLSVLLGRILINQPFGIFKLFLLNRNIHYFVHCIFKYNCSLMWSMWLNFALHRHNELTFCTSDIW